MAFAVAARLPALCLFASILSTLTLHALIAFGVWKVFIGVASSVVGLMMVGDVVVYGIHGVVVQVGDAIRTAFCYVCRR